MAKSRSEAGTRTSKTKGKPCKVVRRNLAKVNYHEYLVIAVGIIKSSGIKHPNWKKFEKVCQTEWTLSQAQLSWQQIKQIYEGIMNERMFKKQKISPAPVPASDIDFTAVPDPSSEPDSGSESESEATSDDGSEIEFMSEGDFHSRSGKSVSTPNDSNSRPGTYNIMQGVSGSTNSEGVVVSQPVHRPPSSPFDSGYSQGSMTESDWALAGALDETSAHMSGALNNQTRQQLPPLVQAGPHYPKPHVIIPSRDVRMGPAAGGRSEETNRARRGKQRGAQPRTEQSEAPHPRDAHSRTRSPLSPDRPRSYGMNARGPQDHESQRHVNRAPCNQVPRGHGPGNRGHPPRGHGPSTIRNHGNQGNGNRARGNAPHGNRYRGCQGSDNQRRVNQDRGKPTIPNYFVGDRSAQFQGKRIQFAP